MEDQGTQTLESEGQAQAIDEHVDELEAGSETAAESTATPSRPQRPQRTMYQPEPQVEQPAPAPAAPAPQPVAETPKPPAEPTNPVATGETATPTATQQEAARQAAFDKELQQIQQAGSALQRAQADIAEIAKQIKSQGAPATPAQQEALESATTRAEKAQAKLEKLATVDSGDVVMGETHNRLVNGYNALAEQVTTLVEQVKQQNEALRSQAEASQREQAESQNRAFWAQWNKDNGLDGAPLLAEAKAEVAKEFPDVDPQTQAYVKLVNQAFSTRVDAAKATLAPRPASPQRPSSRPPTSPAGTRVLQPGAQATPTTQVKSRPRMWVEETA